MYYVTSDFSLAAFLAYSGIKIMRIDGEGFRKQFVFEKTEEELDDLITRFFNKKTYVEPLAFYNELRTLKSRVKN